MMGSANAARVCKMDSADPHMNVSIGAASVDNSIALMVMATSAASEMKTVSRAKCVEWADVLMMHQR